MVNLNFCTDCGQAKAEEWADSAKSTANEASDKARSTADAAKDKVQSTASAAQDKAASAADSTQQSAKETKDQSAGFLQQVNPVWLIGIRYDENQLYFFLVFVQFVCIKL